MTQTKPVRFLRSVAIRLRRHTSSMLVFLLAVSPLSDMATRLGLVEGVIPAASKLLPYEAPALKSIGAFFSQDAGAAVSRGYVSASGP